ncbi:MAG: hypothetical protein KME64_16620 [Scytonematopsis contorta HA4267-MV1]|jgi:hypothetical protein|nr:hypothetical protein [Scytonematopsis contorta HA4267-MV1]
MAYSDFTLTKVRDTFNLKIDEKRNLFSDISGVESSAILKTLLEEYIQLATAINTEKARSELLIAQILTETRRQLQYKISFFSGTEFNVDSSQGLNGFCDFLLCASEEQFEIEAPVITVIEAKNESLKSGIGQCIATMEGAKIFNQKAQREIQKIYGAVTSGTNWRFLVLEGNIVFIDNREYYISEVENILGILLHFFQTD